MESNLTRELKQALKNFGVVKRGEVVLSHGDVSDFYVDIKSAYGEPSLLKLISESIWGIIDKRTTCIVGMGGGGVPLAIALSLKYDLKLTTIRESHKKYGRRNQIDNHIPTPIDKVSIVDDVHTTGKSLEKIIEVLRQTGAEILGCYVVVKRGEGETGLPFHYLLTANELM